MEIDIFFGNNVTLGKKSWAEERLLSSRRNSCRQKKQVLRWAMAYLIALNGNRLGNTYLIFLDGDPIATRPEEPWFTLPDVPQILAWCSKPPLWQVNEALDQKRFLEHFLTPGAWWNQWTCSCRGDFSSTSSCSPLATRLGASLVRDLVFLPFGFCFAQKFCTQALLRPFWTQRRRGSFCTPPLTCFSR